MDRWSAWISILFNKVFIRYCVVGVSGTVIDVATLALLVAVSGIDPQTSSMLYVFTSIAFVLAFVNNFVLNKLWTFELKEKKNTKRQFVKFLIASLVGLVLTNLFMGLFVVAMGIWHIWAKLITSAIVLVWNFFANKYWTFKTRTLAPKRSMRTQFDVELSVVIPAYNEERRLPATLSKVVRYLEDFGKPYEVLVVDDGSTDGTSEAVHTFQMSSRLGEQVRLIQSNKNYGKGSAVAIGMMMAKGAYILFTDADNSTPIEELEGFYAQRERADILIGSRYLTDSRVHVKQPWYRIAIGRIANFIIQLFLVDGIKDTQCGFKMFKHQVAKDIFSRSKVEGFGFDMEALTLAELLGYHIRELPVDWYNSEDSRVRPIKHTFRTLMDLMFIKLQIWTGKYRKKGEIYEHEEVLSVQGLIRDKLSIVGV